MSLWTPYAEETALDLSKPTLKEDPPKSSDLYPIGSDHLQYGYSYPQHWVPVQENLPVGYPAYYGGYPYPPHIVPSTQISPVSGGSTCSYEPVPALPQSPRFVRRNAPLSPPESPMPEDQSLCNLRVDVDELSDDPDFQAFERNALRVMAEKNGGALLGNNPRMRRAVRSTNQDAANDSYRKQRERNNFAAKQSRDRRKLREIHLALKVSYLKNEVANLKAKLSTRLCDRCQQHSL